VSDVVIDSSVWIDFLRGHGPTVARLDPLLSDDRVAVTGPIVAEVASGAQSLASFDELQNRLRALHVLQDPPDLWQRVAAVRFQLARRGVQANLVDLTIAVTASVHSHALMTRDQDFTEIGKTVLLDLHVY